MGRALADLLAESPHLQSPAHLAWKDTGGKFLLPPHLDLINRKLVKAWRTPNSRLAINVPPQHGKSWLTSRYFAAWVLLLWPDTRLVLGSFDEAWSGTFGGQVRAILDCWGGQHGVRLRQDSRAKNEWHLEGHDGGMVCKGRHGSLLGRACDLLLMDDTIKDAMEALSPTILDSVWDWYTTVAYTRLGPQAPIINVGTRWVKRDLFGRIADESKKTGEVWEVIRLQAIAGKDDPLGRPEGAALWPERVPLSRLIMMRDSEERSRWFKANYQQEPVEDTGQNFRPHGWPTFIDVGGAYSLPSSRFTRDLYHRQDCTIIIAVDWATSTRKTSDYTAMGAFALTPDGRLLVLEMVNERFPLDRCVFELARFCRRHLPHVVAVESGGFQGALANECRRWHEIPEPRRLESRGRSKIQRAMSAIMWGENKRIYLPHANPAWQQPFCAQLTGFTGDDDVHDDMVDVLSWSCYVAESIRPSQANSGAQGPCLLTPGRTDYYG